MAKDKTQAADGAEKPVKAKASSGKVREEAGKDGVSLTGRVDQAKEFFEQAKGELQRRLLDEVQPEQGLSAFSGGRKTALALLIVIPLAAVAAYSLLGNPQGLDPMHTQARMSPQDIEGMLGKLVEKLKKNPDDSAGWVMLARSYKALGRYAESAEAYEHGGALLDTEPSLLADYAEVLGQMNGGRFVG